jgi:hypothetical protein
VTWARLEAEAPELARLGRERLATGLAVLGTLRRDGSPRVSPIGVFFLGGELVIGVMAHSGKARDLRRDPRVALQSVVTAPDEGEPELKLYGRVSPSDADGGWWKGGRPDVDVYAVELEEAVYLDWDLAGGTFALRRWRPGRGEDLSEQAYP